MKSIRPFERADSARVASVYERVARSGSRTPAPGLAAYLERLLLDQPWSDPDLPSLVYELDGQIVAFLGIHVRRLQFDGRPIRLAAFGQLVSDPDIRGRPGGALLLRHALGGPQDVSTAYFPTSLARMWESLGGRTRFMTSTGWVRVLRPAGLIAEAALQRGHRPALERFVRPALVRRWRSGRPFLRSAVDDLLGTTDDAPSPDGSVEPLTPAAVVEHLPSVAAGFRIRPLYDAGSLDWLLGELRAVTARGELRARLVRDARGEVCGWYIVLFDAWRIYRVIALVATRTGAGAVFDRLFADAESEGALAVAGRYEPQLIGALWDRPVYVRKIGRDAVHARDPDLLRALLEGDVLITALEGETWMGHASPSVPGAPRPPSGAV